MRFSRFISRFMALMLLSMGLVACGGLAGEPQVIGTIPPPPTSAPIITTELTIPTNIDIALGAEIYAARCTDCHGETGAGDGALVLSGQVPAIADFNDPATIENVTPQDYFRIITDGVLDRLMPPWGNALSESERWAVTMYVYSMSSQDIQTTSTTEDTSSDTTPPIMTTEEAIQPSEPQTTEVETVEDVQTNGVRVRGFLTQGTAGAELPANQEILLHIMDPAFQDNIFTTQVDSEGVFVFDDVPFAESGYIVAVNYQNGYFLSDMAFARPGESEIDLDIVIYESTNEPSALHINNIVYQIEVFDGGIEVGQYMVFTNISDRVFVNPMDDEDAPRTSLNLALPQNAVFSPWANDPQRYLLVNDGVVQDTRAILPHTQHMVQLIYSIEGQGDITFTQATNYPLVGPVEVYASNRSIGIHANNAQQMGQQQFGSRIYNSWVVNSNPDRVSFTIEYNPTQSGVITGVSTTTDSSTLPIGIILMVVGGTILGAGGVMYWRTRRENADAQATDATPSVKEEINQLIKQIGELDLQHQQGKIPQDVHETERKKLKARLTHLMQIEAGAKGEKIK